MPPKKQVPKGHHQQSSPQTSPQKITQPQPKSKLIHVPIPTKSESQIRIDSQKIPSLVKSFNAPNSTTVYDAIVRFRAVIRSGIFPKSFKNECAIGDGVIQKLIRLCSHTNHSIAFEAVWTICTIIGFGIRNARAVVDANALPVFLDILTSLNVEAINQVLWALGQLLAYGDEALAHDVLEHNPLPAVLGAIFIESNNIFDGNITILVSNASKFIHEYSSITISPTTKMDIAIPTLIDLFTKQKPGRSWDRNLALDTIINLSHSSFPIPTSKQSTIKHISDLVMPHIIELLPFDTKNPTLTQTLLQIISNILFVSPSDTPLLNRILQGSLLTKLQSALMCENETIQSLVANILAHCVFIGRADFVSDFLIQSNILQTVIFQCSKHRSDQYIQTVASTIALVTSSTRNEPSEEAIGFILDLQGVDELFFLCELQTDPFGLNKCINAFHDIFMFREWKTRMDAMITSFGGEVKNPVPKTAIDCGKALLSRVYGIWYSLMSAPGAATATLEEMGWKPDQEESTNPTEPKTQITEDQAGRRIQIEWCKGRKKILRQIIHLITTFLGFYYYCDGSSLYLRRYPTHPDSTVGDVAELKFWTREMALSVLEQEMLQEEEEEEEEELPILTPSNSMETPSNLSEPPSNLSKTPSNVIETPIIVEEVSIIPQPPIPMMEQHSTIHQGKDQTHIIYNNGRRDYQVR